MKTASPYLSACLAGIFGAAFCVATVAQQAPAGHEHPPAPAPTNLQVLPKTLTGEQVHEIMHKWAGELGTQCTTCHAVDATKKMPDGRPMMNFADDSKPEKATARIMLKMSMTINNDYISKLDDPDAKVSCGTCHRGHLMPEAFVPAPMGHDHPPAPPSK